MNIGLVRVDRWGRLAVPSLLTLVLLIAQLLPWSYAAPSLLPSLALMGVFFWSLRLPAFFPPFLAFLTGLVADVSELTAFGAQAFAFLILSLVLRRRTQTASLPFLRLWAAFALAALGVSVVLWMIEALFGGHLVPLGQVLARTALTIAVFPLVTRFILMPAERIAREGENG